MLEQGLSVESEGLSLAWRGKVAANAQGARALADVKQRRFCQIVGGMGDLAHIASAGDLPRFGTKRPAHMRILGQDFILGRCFAPPMLNGGDGDKDANANGNQQPCGQQAQDGDGTAEQGCGEVRCHGLPYIPARNIGRRFAGELFEQNGCGGCALRGNALPRQQQ